MALPVLRFIRKEITKQVSYELHALRAIKIFFKDFRVYLKTVNTPKQRVFSTCWAPFFLAIRRVFLQKNGAQQAENPSPLVIFPVFR